MAQGTVLVTGVTAGLGNRVGHRLTERGYRVIALCRNAEQAAALTAEGACTDCVLADLGLPDTVQGVPAQLAALGVEELAGFVHCAAISAAAPLETMDLADARRLFEVNIFGFAALLQGVTDLVRRGRGRMVLTGSVGGFSVWPMLAMYDATKHAFEALVAGARRELWPWGVEVVLIRPGGIRSRMLQLHKAEMTSRLEALDGVDRRLYPGLYRSYTRRMHEGHKVAASPDRLARTMVRIFEAKRPRTAYNLGFDCRALRVADRLVPARGLDRMIRAIFPVRYPDAEPEGPRRRHRAPSGSASG